MFHRLREIVLFVSFLFFFGFAISPVFADDKLKLGKTTVDSEVNDQSADAAAATELSLKEFADTFETKLKLAINSGVEKGVEPVKTGLNEILTRLPPPKKSPTNVAALISSTPTAPVGSPQPTSPTSSATEKASPPSFLSKTATSTVSATQVATSTGNASNPSQAVSLVRLAGGSATPKTSTTSSATARPIESISHEPANQIREKTLDRPYTALLVSAENVSQASPQTFSQGSTDQPNSSDLASVYKSMGADLRKSGRFNEAIQYMKEALKHDPKSSAVNFELGLAFASSGETDKAITHLEEALRLDPNLTLAREHLHALHKKQAVSRRI